MADKTYEDRIHEKKDRKTALGHWSNARESILERCRENSPDLDIKNKEEDLGEEGYT